MAELNGTLRYIRLGIDKPISIPNRSINSDLFLSLEKLVGFIKSNTKSTKIGKGTHLTNMQIIISKLQKVNHEQFLKMLKIAMSSKILYQKKLDLCRKRKEKISAIQLPPISLHKYKMEFDIEI